MKKHLKKREPRQGIRIKDPQEPSRGADPFRHKVKGRLGQLERKRQKKKIRNKKQKKQSASRTQRPIMAQTEKKPRGTRKGKHKKRIITSGFQFGRTRFRPDGKREKWKLQKNEDTEKGIPQHVPKKVVNQELSKRSELKEGKNEKTRNVTYRVIGTGHALFARKQNWGTNGSLGRPELHYKREGWVAKRR